MKRILLSTLIALTAGLSYGQGQIENPGFEDNWSTTGVYGSEPEPGEWSGLKSSDDNFLASFAPVTAFQETTDPHTGTYCIRLTVSSTSNANGLLTNGRVHADFNPELGYVFTEPSDSIWHLSFNDRPDSLVFWVKHTPESNTNGEDKSKVEILLHDNSLAGELPHNGTTTHWVGKARADVTGTISNWQRMSVPFMYFNSNTPDYALMVLSAGDSTIALPGTDMWVDDIELIYNPISTSIDPSASQSIDVCTLGDVLTVTENTNVNSPGTITREWKWSTTPGGPYSSFAVPETGTTYTPLFTTIDDFYVICESDYGSQGILTSNEVQITTVSGAGNSVSISPVATQNINENENGTDLSAVECPTATSREWMWTTTSGSGYQSFVPAENGTTYTPNFATAGTYYVICESDFSGDIQQSNEVTIMVDPEGTGINEAFLTLNLFHNGEAIQVNADGLVNDVTIEFYTLDGKQLYNAVLQNGTTLHSISNTSGILVYRVLNGDMIITGKVKM